MIQSVLLSRAKYTKLKTLGGKKKEITFGGKSRLQYQSIMNYRGHAVNKKTCGKNCIPKKSLGTFMSITFIHHVLLCSVKRRDLMNNFKIGYEMHRGELRNFFAL